MKWYSLNKHIPPAYTYLFIRAITKSSGYLYDRNFVGMIENIEDARKLNAWEMANGQNYSIVPDDYEVTHFCIIDPVEIEE